MSFYLGISETFSLKNQRKHAHQQEGTLSSPSREMCAAPDTRYSQNPFQLYPVLFLSVQSRPLKQQNTVLPVSKEDF